MRVECVRRTPTAVQLPMDVIRNASRMHSRSLRDLEIANGATVMLWPDDGLVVVHAASAATATTVLDLAVGIVQGVAGSDRRAGRGGPGDTSADSGPQGHVRDGRGGGRGGDGERIMGRGDRGSGGRGGGAGGSDLPPWRQGVLGRARGEGGSGEHAKEAESAGRRGGRHAGETGVGRGAFGAEQHGRGRGRDGVRGGRGGEGRVRQEGNGAETPEQPERGALKERPTLYRPTRSDVEEG